MNHSIIYLLPDGEEIDISKIKSIGTLKSVRSKDFASLGYWYFTIFFKDETSKELFFSKTKPQKRYKKVIFIVTGAK
jgi:hypothetical protein